MGYGREAITAGGFDNGIHKFDLQRIERLYQMTEKPCSQAIQESMVAEALMSQE